MAFNSPRKASLSAFQTAPSLVRTAATYTMLVTHLLRLAVCVEFHQATRSVLCSDPGSNPPASLPWASLAVLVVHKKRFMASYTELCTSHAEAADRAFRDHLRS
jgi:hypothetical protein